MISLIRRGKGWEGTLQMMALGPHDPKLKLNMFTESNHPQTKLYVYTDNTNNTVNDVQASSWPSVYKHPKVRGFWMFLNGAAAMLNH